MGGRAEASVTPKDLRRVLLMSVVVATLGSASGAAYAQPKPAFSSSAELLSSIESGSGLELVFALDEIERRSHSETEWKAFLVDVDEYLNTQQSPNLILGTLARRVAFSKIHPLVVRHVIQSGDWRVRYRFIMGVGTRIPDGRESSRDDELLAATILAAYDSLWEEQAVTGETKAELHHAIRSKLMSAGAAGIEAMYDLEPWPIKEYEALGISEVPEAKQRLSDIYASTPYSTDEEYSYLLESVARNLESLPQHRERVVNEVSAMLTSTDERVRYRGAKVAGATRDARLLPVLRELESRSAAFPPGQSPRAYSPSDTAAKAAASIHMIRRYTDEEYRRASQLRMQIEALEKQIADEETRRDAGDSSSIRLRSIDMLRKQLDQLRSELSDVESAI